MEIRLKTLTPIWTGGVDGTSDRLHETGLIGSLRWWYEALVRGLGGYACDPSAENPQARCGFDTKAYEKAIRDGMQPSAALQVGLKTVCPVCYLFGATSWARLFRLRAADAPTVPLHFRTSLQMNEGWLKRVFGGKAQQINNLRVPYGDLALHILFRGYDEEYAQHQLAMLFHLMEEYGGLGARLQHGFGQVQLKPSQAGLVTSIAAGMTELVAKLGGGLRSAGPSVDTPYDLRQFVSMTFDVPMGSLSRFMSDRAHVGNGQKRNEKAYIPCAFDLRYKGAGKLGMRRWLEEPEGWSEADINALMGVSEKRNETTGDDERQASRVCFGMPYQMNGEAYRLRMFGFAPPAVLTANALQDLCAKYVESALSVKPTTTTLGADLLAQAQGEGR